MRKTSVFVASIACGVNGPLILRQTADYQQVRLHDKLANEFLVNPRARHDADPVFLVHVVTRSD